MGLRFSTPAKSHYQHPHPHPWCYTQNVLVHVRCFCPSPHEAIILAKASSQQESENEFFMFNVDLSCMGVPETATTSVTLMSFYPSRLACAALHGDRVPTKLSFAANSPVSRLAAKVQDVNIVEISLDSFARR